MPFLPLSLSAFARRSVPAAQPRRPRPRLLSVPGRGGGEPESGPSQAARRRFEQGEPERAAPARHLRRRRQNGPWLQRNALSVAAVSVLVAMASVGFALLQVVKRPSMEQPAPAMVGVSTPGQTTALPGQVTTSSLGQSSTSSGTPATLGGTSDSPHEIQRTVRVLEPNYTIAAGDTLARIAARFNTSVERIQALNKLTDPRALRIGAKLVIPPPL